MRRQLDLVGRDRPRPCAITTRNADKREARRSHHAEPDSITRKKKRGVQPRSLLRYRMRYPRENQAAAEVQPKEQKKPHPQKWRERFAEPIRRRTAPLCLRQIERRGRDHRALRDAKEEQQVDEIGFPCDRRAASNQRKHERDRAEHDHRASDRLHGRAGHRLYCSRLHRRALAMRPLKIGAHRGCAPSSRTTSSAPDSFSIDSTRAASASSHRTTIPNRSSPKRPLYPGAIAVVGTPDSISTPKKPKIPPNRTISSKQMMMNGGHDSSGLPPALRRHSQVVPIVIARPVRTPEIPPASTSHRTGLFDLPIACSILWLGIGANVLKSPTCAARSSSIACAH